MKLTLFSTQNYDRLFFNKLNQQHFRPHGFIINYQNERLTEYSVSLARGSNAVCIFVNDCLDKTVIHHLVNLGVRAVLLRCAGFDNVDLRAAKEAGLFIARVPSYSPESVAEHTVALIMTMTRNIHRAYNRVREGNFQLDGLLGKTLHGKTVGIIGTGKIGLITARILKGFGCHLLGFDPVQNQSFSETGQYVALDMLLNNADIISLHCPFTSSTRHIINRDSLESVKKGAMLVNTSRGALIDTAAVTDALKSRHLGALVMDVYEQESELFFHDHSSEVISDDIFQRLMTFPNVLITGHQAFFTEEALSEIASVTLYNLQCFAESRSCENQIAIKKD